MGNLESLIEIPGNKGSPRWHVNLKLICNMLPETLHTDRSEGLADKPRCCPFLLLCPIEFLPTREEVAGISLGVLPSCFMA